MLRRLLGWNRSAAGRDFVREADRLPHYGTFDLVHAYLYLRWAYAYIAIGTGEHPLARVLGRAWGWLSRRFGREREESGPSPGAARRARSGAAAFADGYHGKVTTPRDARTLITLREPIRITASEQVIPYGRARDIVMKNPDHIVALDCPCRAAREDPCLPLDVCLIVGEPFASLIVESHPRRARWIDPARAAKILDEEHARGHVHHAFFKDAMLERFYAICNCCPCCCGAMQAYRDGTPMLASSGYVSRVDPDACIACAACEEVCPFEAVSIALDHAEVDEATCMGCGVCVDVCPTEAHELRLDPSRGEPLEVRPLAACPVMSGEAAATARA